MKKIVYLFIFIKIFCGVLFSETFYFVQVTDIYLGAENILNENDKKESEYRLKALVNTLNKLEYPIEFVVFTGNITFNGIKQEDIYVKKGISELLKINKKKFFIPGNHDIYPAGDATKFNVKNFEETFGQISFVYELANVRMIFFFGENLRIPFVIDGYDPFKWLEKQLKDSEEKPILIFTHSVPGDECEEGEIKQLWDKKNSEIFKSIVNNYNVKAIIAGHENSDKIRWIGDVPVYIEPNFSVFGGRQASFRIYKYKDGKLSYITKYIEK